MSGSTIIDVKAAVFYLESRLVSTPSNLHNNMTTIFFKDLFCVYVPYILVRTGTCIFACDHTHKRNIIMIETDIRRLRSARTTKRCGSIDNAKHITEVSRESHQQHMQCRGQKSRQLSLIYTRTISKYYVKHLFVSPDR